MSAAGWRRSGPTAPALVDVAEKMEATSLLQLPPKSGWACDGDITGNVTDGEGAERLQVAGGEAAMLTSPVNRLRRGSAHSPPPPEADVDGSKVKRPL